MKTFNQRMSPAAIIAGLLLVLPMTAVADKDSGPNKKSKSITAACLETDTSVHVYSCKALSNVVIWCDSTYIKFDDIGLDPITGVTSEVTDGVFTCPEGSEGPITYVAIKSGSLKHAKHNDGYTAPGGLAGLSEPPPSGSGLFLPTAGDPLPSCVDFNYPMPGTIDCEYMRPPVDPDGVPQ